MRAPSNRLLIRVSLSDHGKVKANLKVPPIVQYRPPLRLEKLFKLMDFAKSIGG